jgi:hypothetical protein
MSEKCQRESPYIAPLPVRDRYGLGPVGGSLVFEMDAGPLAASRTVIVDDRDVSLPNIRYRVLVNNVVVAHGSGVGGGGCQGPPGHEACVIRDGAGIAGFYFFNAGSAGRARALVGTRDGSAAERRRTTNPLAIHGHRGLGAALSACGRSRCMWYSPQVR